VNYAAYSGQSAAYSGHQWVGTWAWRDHVCARMSRAQPCRYSSDHNQATVNHLTLVTVVSAREQLPELLEQYDARDILNADETGVYFRALPDSTYAKKDEKHQAKGYKTAKDRITLLVCCGMDSHKEDFLLIGKSKNPCCFKNIQNLPLQYESSSNAWMTGTIWEGWLRKLDRKFQRENRKALLLIDNCTAHVDVRGLKSIAVKLLPPNTTSILQLCDMGVIRTLKAHFRHEIRKKIIDVIEDSNENSFTNDVVKKFDLLDTMNLLEGCLVTCN